MKSTYYRRYRRSPSRSIESAMFKKDSQHEHAFFAAPSEQSFFKPNIAIQRKCADCEAEEKNVKRMAEPKDEEKKVQKMSDNKEEEVHRTPENKEEEKIHKMEDRKEPEIHREPEKGDAEKEQYLEAYRQPEHKEEEKSIAKKDSNASGNGGIAATGTYIQSLNGKGSALPKEAQYFFGERMGYDFSNVKIHTGTKAEKSAKDINAKAYAVDNNIVFNKGQYNPGSQDGKKLLAHELTHVVQQKKGSCDIQPYIQRNLDDKAPVNADIPPIVVIGKKHGSKKKEKELIKEQEKAQEIASKSYKELNTWYEIFINLWLGSANTALFQAEVPEDATQKSNYNTALAGNLLWAATSLFPEAKAAVVTLSFVGSYIGSGGLAQQVAPTGIGDLAGYLSKSRDALLTKSIEIRQDVAIECAFQKITGIEDQKRLLWQHMFAGIPYNSSDAIREVIRKKLNGALIQFNIQWKQWREKLDQCKIEMEIDPDSHHETELANNEKEGKSKHEGKIQTKQIPDIQRQVMLWITPDYTKKCESMYPFQPVLKF